MKAKQLITLLFLVFSMTFYGQESKKEKIKALKIAYITKDLNLSSSEAEKFWPVYNRFDEKQFEIRRVKMRKIRQDLKNKSLDHITETEANTLLNEIESLETETYQNSSKFIVELRKIISPVKILKLKQAEDDFNKTLLKQYRKRN
jgi:hypothetical protein